MRYTLLFSILLLFCTSCKKSKFSSTPSLTFKSVNTTELHNQQLLEFTLGFTDAEGDLTDSIFVSEVVPQCANSNFGSFFPLPAFPTSKNQEGNIIVTFGYNVTGYQTISPKCGVNDTAIFRFALRDKALHVSDTVSSPRIILFN